MPDIKIDNILNRKEERTRKGDKLISMAIMSSFGVLTIQYFILYYFNIDQTSIGSQIQLMSKAIVGLFFLIAIPIVMKRNWPMFVGTYMVSVFIFLHNYLVFPKNSQALLSVAFPFFFICLPSFVFSFSINDKNILMNIIYKVSNMVFIIGTLIGIFTLTNRMSVGDYSMALSYYMLLPGIINMYKFIINKSASSMIKVIVSLLIILALGSRGAIMCFAAYTILSTIKNMKKITCFSLLSYTSIFLTLILGITYFKNLIMYIYEFLMKFGVSSRTLYLFTQDDLHLSGRDSLIEEITRQIIENPIKGIGIAGDRIIIGGYSHNIFIEILSAYGVIIGIIIIAIIVLICYIGIFNKNKFDSNIIIIWFSLGFMPLLVSGTYLMDFTFWIFLGLTIRVIINRNTIKRKIVLGGKT
jgi:hypothetical protein